MHEVLRDDDRARAARARHRDAKREFNRIAALALKGEASPKEATAALAAVNAAMAELRAAEH